MNFTLGLPEICVGALALCAVQVLVTLWISERLKASLQKENAVFLESLKWDLKVREQAARVAEYMAIARDLTARDSAEEYRKLNRLSWELAMWLPDGIYKAMVRAIKTPDDKTNPLSVAIEVRQLLLGKAAGNLTQNDLSHHAPGIGRRG